MIHFRKSKNYLEIARLNFKDNSDCVNGLIEIDETKRKLNEPSAEEYS